LRPAARLACALVALPTFALAQAGTYREFGTWTVACDNGLACAAFGTSEADRGGRRYGLRISRAAGYAGKIRIAFNGKSIDDEEHILVDGKIFPIESRQSMGAGSLPDEPMLGVVRSLLNATKMTMPGEEKAGETVSLAGLKAALLFMDERQGRSGGRNAFVSRGDSRSATPPPAYPIVRAAAAPDTGGKSSPDAAGAVARRVMAHHRRSADARICDIGTEPGSRESPVAHPLGKGLTLMEVYCWRAAYQAGSVFYLHDAARGAVADARFEQLDAKAGALRIGKAESISSPDVEGGAISSLHKSRGGGGCGVQMSWRWDGRVFRLTSYAQKLLCDHTDATFRLHRTRIRGPDGKTIPVGEDADEDGEF
jgi:hypothetical protein